MMIFFVVVGLGALAMLVWRNTSAEANFPSIEEGTMSFRSALLNTFLPDEEIGIISMIAANTGIDARLLAAIRRAENGGPGREFGIVSIPAATYELQAQYAANTIRNNQARYEAATGLSATNGGGRFTDDFLEYLGNRYAPVGAGNDPTGLNRNWVTNVTAFYRSIEYA